MFALTQRSYYVIGVLLLILACGAAITYFVFLSPTGFKAREHADFGRIQPASGNEYTTLSGEVVDLETYRGDILIVNVWASWSPFTVQDHEVLARLKAFYGKDVTVLALNRMETKETAEAYLSTIEKKDGIEYIMDGSDSFFTSLGGYAMPETIIFDSVGNIFFHKRGTITETEVKQAVEALQAK